MSKRVTTLAVLAFIVAALALLGLKAQHYYLHPTIDKNGDGVPDEWFHYDWKRRLVSLKKDRNFDGRVDHVESYVDGKVRRVSIDMNNDGNFELLSIYDENERLLVMKRDTDEEGGFDYIKHFDPKTGRGIWYEEDADYDGIMDGRVDLE